MTNHWIDIRNSDYILIMGANPAENHPVSFKWIIEAENRGAVVINVDPRFTRTSSKADIYVRLRPGTDIAFLGGMIKYIIENDLIDKDYVVECTNAAFLVDERFGFKDGLFSGYDPKTERYIKETWAYQLDANGLPKVDKTLGHPNCVYQLLRRHFLRYNFNNVSSTTGTPMEDLLKVYHTYAQSGRPGKAGTILYAMGWTQHTVGTQNIRAMAIIQLLLGNMGIAGGGVNALRGESNVQGATDHGLLWDTLPGYLKTPMASDATLQAYLKRRTPASKDPLSVNWWKNYPNYIVSLLKAYYGDAATKDNEFCYQFLPRADDGVDYSWISLFESMYAGNIEGFFAWGQNPACSSPNVEMTRKALEKLKWMVNVNLWETETASFWKRPGADPNKIQTEVFLLPCAASMEKEGSITNSGRWSQWRYKAVDPPRDAKPDPEIINALFMRLRQLYQKEKGTFPEPILNLAWEYGPTDRTGQVTKIDIHRVAKAINGYFLDGAEKGKLAPGFGKLRDDGTTSSGNWLYCGSYTEKGNMAASRDKTDPGGIGLFPNWAWSWPLNRRILYNRASVKSNGEPRDAEHPVIKWDGKQWLGDVPDGPAPPGQCHPFIMTTEGYGRIFGPGLADGPFPEHYEPMESPVRNIFSSVQTNPVIKRWDKLGSDMDHFATVGSELYPIVATTYRLSEHWQTGCMTRQQPWLVELVPEMCVEISTRLAERKGIRNGEMVTVVSARGKIRARAIVTDRILPLRIDGKLVEVIGLPWCFGYIGLARGDSANSLTPNIGDANTMIQESKAFLVDVRKGEEEA